MTAASTIVSSVSGRVVSVRGNDIDTDRIIPARFLRCVTFDGLGEHAFEDDRRGLKAKGQTHSFDEAKYQGASILFVNKNFGCGSSREHAPQALMRWGIQAVVGESFAEIFFGNCVSLGIPCVTVDEAAIAKLMAAAEANSTASWTLDLEAQKISGPVSETATMPEGPRSQFLSGKWNPMSELLSHLAEVDSVGAALPYVSGRW
ncbi:MAG TPA: 3-isopropylmalate dehydratase small subunit [Fibrobacteres bacterium]|jgi:3-isopropylmalate/(R)-2-methylmalate dehydratase small subunit|nr:3-isopropylmalate dehydratase small subunit [Fibrobacterota bacterium]